VASLDGHEPSLASCQMLLFIVILYFELLWQNKISSSSSHNGRHAMITLSRPKSITSVSP